MPVEIGAALQLELAANDPYLNEFEKGAAAMAALEMHTGARDALAKRSRCPKRVAHGMAVGASGQDLKKGQWAVAGRPLICSTAGFGSDESWFDLASEVLARDDFNARCRSLTRAHDGEGGDPSRATRWLLREPSEQEWNATLAHLWRARVHTREADGAWKPVTPQLVQLSGNARVPTKHSLKSCKPASYVACRLHTDYAVEAGAHAGSQLERMSVDGMQQQLRQLRPRGLKVALRYARAAAGAAVAEVDAMVAATVRAWVQSVGVTRIPRTNSWAALAAWVTQQIASAATLEDPARERNPRQAPPPDPLVEQVVGEDGNRDEVEIEVEAEWDE